MSCLSASGSIADPPAHQRLLPSTLHRAVEVVVASRTYQNVLAAALLGMLPFVIYWFLWLPGHQETISIDYPYNQPPQQMLFLQQVHRGFWPLWAPGDSGGLPWGNYFQAQQYSPFTWLLGLCPSAYEPLQVQLLTLMRLTLLGMSSFFTYLLARRMGFTGLASLIAGTIFVFNTRMLDCFRYATALDTAVWLPVMVYLCERMIARPGLPIFCLISAVEYLMIVVGHTQVGFYCIVFSNAWFLVRTLILGRQLAAGSWGWYAGRWSALVAAQVVSLALSAVYWIAVVSEMFPLWTKRTAGGESYTYMWHQTWQGLFYNVFWPWCSEVQSGFYCGQIVWLLLATAAAVMMCRRRQLRNEPFWTVAFLMGVAAFCAVYSLGPLTPLAPMLHRIIPALATFRGLGRCMIVAVFAMSLLAAFVVDFLLRDQTAWSVFKRVGIGLSLAGLLAALLLLTAWCCGWVHGEDVHSQSRPWLHRRFWLPLFGRIPDHAPVSFRGTNAIVAYMAVVAVLTALLNLLLFWLGSRGRFSRTSVLIMLWGVGLVDVACFLRHGVWTRPGPYYATTSQRIASVDVYHTRIFENDWLYRYSRRNIAEVPGTGQLHLIFDTPTPICRFLEQGGANAWRIYYGNVQGHEMPRAYLTPGLRLVQGDPFPAIRSMNMYAESVLRSDDPINKAALQAKLPADLPRVDERFGRQDFLDLNRKVSVRSYTANKASFEVSTSRPALFNYADMYFPGWTARVDGRQVPLCRVNDFFKGVLLPAGSHVVEFAFEPRRFRLGLMISLGTFCLWLAMIAIAFFRRLGPRIAAGTLVAMASAAGAVTTYQHIRVMINRDGLANFDPAAPRPCTPDLDEYLAASGMCFTK